MYIHQHGEEPQIGCGAEDFKWGSKNICQKRAAMSRCYSAVKFYASARLRLLVC